MVYRSSEDVADMYARGATKGKSGHGNIFIEGRTIYSYGHHFPIATRTGKNTYLFTTQGYSRTTSRHKWGVLHALERSGAKIKKKESWLVR